MFLRRLLSAGHNHLDRHLPTVPWYPTAVGTGIDTVTVVSPTGASTYNSYIPFLRQRGEASAGGCLGTSMASNGLNLAKLRGLVY